MAFKADLPRRLRSLARKYQVPGASIGILRRGRILATASTGVTNLDTRVPVTDDTVFQIGSITKVFTTSLIMQLVDEGVLSLDDTVRKHLPEFRVADLSASAMVTIRDLLCHRSGIDGDFFVDSGRGDDNTARLLGMATMVPSLFPVGERHSYCNLGFVVLGRIIEVCTGLTWDEAMKQNLFTPLGMQQAMTLPEDALRYRCAIGHVPSRRKKDVWYPSRVPYLSQGQKAAGATPAMSVTDLLKFARMHLDGGRNDSGETVISRRGVRDMQQRQISLPKHMPRAISHWGLGWFLINWDGTRLYGHDGATIGQYAFLRVLPEQDMAVALLTNGGDAQGFAGELLNETFAGLARRQEPAPPADNPGLRFNPEDYKGDYANMTATLSVTARAGQLRIRSTLNGGDEGPEQGRLVPVTKDVFRLDSANPMLARMQILFSRDDTGAVGFAGLGMRQYARL